MYCYRVILSPKTADLPFEVQPTQAIRGADFARSANCFILGHSLWTSAQLKAKNSGR
jgi:hypothetical protein